MEIVHSIDTPKPLYCHSVRVRAPTGGGGGRIGGVMMIGGVMRIAGQAVHLNDWCYWWCTNDGRYIRIWIFGFGIFGFGIRQNIFFDIFFSKKFFSTFFFDNFFFDFFLAGGGGRARGRKKWNVIAYRSYWRSCISLRSRQEVQQFSDNLGEIIKLAH